MQAYRHCEEESEYSAAGACPQQQMLRSSAAHREYSAGGGLLPQQQLHRASSAHHEYSAAGGLSQQQQLHRSSAAHHEYSGAGGLSPQQQLHRSSHHEYSGAGGLSPQQQLHQSSSAHHEYSAAGGGGLSKQQQLHQSSMASQNGYGVQIQKTQSFKSETMVNVFGHHPFYEIKPSAFPPGTDAKVIACFERIDRNRNGVIDDKELQNLLSSYNNNTFSLRTVHLLMYEFTGSNRRMIGPKEFIPLLNCIQTWRTMFQKFDRDRSGCIDSLELGQALNSLGYCVSPIIINLLIAKYAKYGGKCSLQYDAFVECCLIVKGLTETFKAKEDHCGKATFAYEEFLLNVLPFIIA